MKGTINGNWLPRGTRVKKGWEPLVYSDTNTGSAATLNGYVNVWLAVEANCRRVRNYVRYLATNIVTVDAKESESRGHVSFP